MEFQICKAGDKSTLEASQELGDGDVMVMCGQMQKHYLHQVPVRHHDSSGDRFNLTFRSICNHQRTCRFAS